MFFPERDAFFEKPVEFYIFFEKRPIEPAGLVVLTPGIVVAVLCASKFVSSADHWYTLGEKQQDRESLQPAHPETSNLCRTIKALPATVPTNVVVIPVSIVFSVGPIVFLVVADQVTEGKTIMTG